MKRLIKLCTNVLLGDYQIFRVFRFDLDTLAAVDISGYLAQGYVFREVSADELSASADDAIRSYVTYGGRGALGFAVWDKGEVVCLQWYWFGARYRSRNFWPLKDDEAKSVALFTLPSHRGSGLATALKLYSAERMKKKGFHRLFSRIWHTHRASRRVSEKAGWRNIAIVAEVYPFGLRKKFRLVRHLDRDRVPNQC